MKRPRIDLLDLPANITAADAQDIINTVDDWDTNVDSGEVLATLRSKMKINHELRIKFSSVPQKYIESEVDLDEAIKSVTLLAADKDSLISFIKAKGLSILAELIDHDNTDIAS
jgi:beta-catenin-like protein 1